MAWSVRPAEWDDLDSIVKIFLGCWQVNYGATLGPLLVSRMDETRARALWEPLLRQRKPGNSRDETVLVAVQSGDGSAVGETEVPKLAGVTRFELIGERTAEIHSLYVSPLVQGAGLGRLLVSAACDTAGLRGATHARLWVFRQNLPALGFYRAQGWSSDGTERVEPGFDEPEMRLSKPLRVTQTPPGQVGLG